MAGIGVPNSGPSSPFEDLRVAAESLTTISDQLKQMLSQQKQTLGGPRGIGSFNWIGQSANAGSDAIQNQFSAGPIGRTLQRAPKVSMLGKVGRVAGAFGVLVLATETLTKAFLRRADQLSGLSPDLAMAKAMNQVNNLMADIREAQALGPDMAKLSMTVNSIEIEIREILLPIKRVIVGGLADFMKGVLDVLKATSSILPKMEQVKSIWAEAKDLYTDGLQKVLGFKLEGMLEMMKKAEEANRKAEAANKAKEILEDLFQNAAKEMLPAPQAPFVPPKGGALNLPFVLDI